MKKRISQIFDFMRISQRLKDEKRWKGIPQMKRKETSADHSWSLAIFCLVVAEEFDFKLDVSKVLKIALTHDLVEALAGDVASLLIIKGLKSQQDKDEKEIKAIKKIKRSLPRLSGDEVEALWYEYQEGNTREARFVKAMDKLESQIHMLNVGEKCFHDPIIMGEYTKKAVLNFPDLLPLNQFIQEKKEAAFGKLGWHWKQEYNLDLNDRKFEKDKIEKIFKFMSVAWKLKSTKRYLNTKEMKKKESSADHSWHVSILSFIVAKELELKVNTLKSIEIAIVHDLVEAIAGDTDHSLIAWGIKSKEEKKNAENLAMETIKIILPHKTGNRIYTLWHEYEDAVTDEARYIKVLDKIEGINHMHCIGTKCFDHPELIAPYPSKAVKNYPPIAGMLVELHNRLMPQFKEKGWPWLKKYADFLKD